MEIIGEVLDFSNWVEAILASTSMKQRTWKYIYGIFGWKAKRHSEFLRYLVSACMHSRI